jgi:hypothetical protein
MVLPYATATSVADRPSPASMDTPASLLSFVEARGDVRL